MTSHGQSSPEPLPSKPAERREFDIFHSVLQLGKEVTQVAGFRDAILRIHEAARRGLGFDRASIWLYNPATNLFHGSLGTNTTGEVIEEWNLSYAAPGWGGMLNDPAWLLHTRNFPTENAADPQVMEGVHEHAGVALWAGVKPLGVLCVDNLLTQRRFTDDQLAALRFFAGYAGVAIENARLMEAARASEQKYRDLVQSANSIIMRLDTSGRITFFNEFAQRFFGYAEHEILGRNVVGTIIQQSDSSGGDIAAIVTEIQRDPARFAMHESENIRRNGEHVWVMWTNKPIPADDGRVAGVLCVGNDITERKRVEAALAVERAKLRTVIDNLPDAVFMKDRQSRFILCNPQTLQTAGFGMEHEMLGKTDLDLYPRREVAEEWFAEEQELLRTGKPMVNKDETYIVAGGSQRSWLSTKVALRDQNGAIVGLLGINRDVTALRRLDEAVQIRTRELEEANRKLREEVAERQKAEESLKYYAFHDALTDLPNRTLFLDRLQQAVRQKERRPEFAFGVLFLDLNDFKDVNDALGHETGDALLKIVAERFRKCLRPTDTLARFGGDEFTVLLYDIKHARDSEDIVERLLQSLLDPIKIGESTLPASVSIGAAISMETHKGADELLREADIAMYSAKARRRAR